MIGKFFILPEDKSTITRVKKIDILGDLRDQYYEEILGRLNINQNEKILSQENTSYIKKLFLVVFGEK